MCMVVTSGKGPHEVPEAEISRKGQATKARPQENLLFHVSRPNGRHHHPPPPHRVALGQLYSEWGERKNENKRISSKIKAPGVFPRFPASQELVSVQNRPGGAVRSRSSPRVGGHPRKTKSPKKCIGAAGANPIGSLRAKKNGRRRKTERRSANPSFASPAEEPRHGIRRHNSGRGDRRVPLFAEPRQKGEERAKAAAVLSRPRVTES